eukprot:509537-Pleurochrysis_carterae.AAC.2
MLSCTWSTRTNLSSKASSTGSSRTWRSVSPRRSLRDQLPYPCQLTQRRRTRRRVEVSRRGKGLKEAASKIRSGSGTIPGVGCRRTGEKSSSRRVHCGWTPRHQPESLPPDLCTCQTQYRIRHRESTKVG